MIALLALLAIDADLTRLFPREAEVQAEPGLSRVPLTPEVLGECQPDLSDLRLFDAAGREVPYVIDSGDVQGQRESLRLKINKVNRDASPQDNPVYRETIDTSAPSDGGWTLVFDTPLNEMIRNVRVTAVSKSGTTELANATLFRLPVMQAERLSIPIKVNGAERLVIAIEGAANGYLQPTITAVRRTLYGGTDLFDVPLTRVHESHSGKRTIVRYARPPGIVPSAIEITTSTELYNRTLRVFDEGQAIADRMLATGRVFRVQGHVEVVANEVPLPVPARGERLRLELDNGDSPPLDQIMVSARVRQPVIVFNATAQRYTLRFGGSRVRRPIYDVSGLIAADANSAVQLLTAKAAKLLPSRNAEGFDAKPALAFAMHAGAKIDVSIFSHRAIVSLTPSTDGLSSVLLPASITTVARADLGDVRIVDKHSQQWPFLVGPTPLLEVRALTITPVTKNRSTRYDLKDTFAPMRLDRVELDIPAPYMDREASLIGTDPSDREVILATSRLVRRADDPGGTVVTIAFAPTLLKSLALVVQDKDDAPLQISAATARHVRQKLFVAAAPGSYVLLTGNADITRPSYELEAARDTVLAVTAEDALLSDLSVNPDYRAASTIAAGEHGMQIVLWLIIALAVLILGALTLRLAKTA